MSGFVQCTVLVLALGLPPGPGTAQTELPAALQPDAIRAAYAAAVEDTDPLPPLALAALVAAEDRDFFDRPPAASTISLAIAAWYPDPSADRLSRMAAGIAIGTTLNWEEILDWYARRVFFGQGCFGIEGAARAYFGREIGELGPGDFAFLAALPKAPARFHPVRDLARATGRRDFVLGEMVKTGALDAEEAEAARAQPLGTLAVPGTCAR
ncbi:transglycosylase domain-containing protein [Oceaniglobus roseus]|uniref:transglycosylase domain-containing protein n=1 Tax=Oceaniglobus roseus TaxID=1737570 RepID=UPI0013000BA6|nr:transglycosylase domain-containing protein [Kandeliimicrobium roseum]